MSLESEQLQLSVYEIMGFTHTSSGNKYSQNRRGEFEPGPHYGIKAALRKDHY